MAPSFSSISSSLLSLLYLAAFALAATAPRGRDVSLTKFEQGADMKNVRGDHSDIAIVMKNANPAMSICVFTEIKYSTEYRIAVREAEIAGVKLHPGEAARISNIFDYYGNGNHTGTMSARNGCDTRCRNCAGIEEAVLRTVTNDPEGDFNDQNGQPLSSDVHTRYEWTVSSGALSDYINLVHGFSMNVGINVTDTYGHEDGAACSKPTQDCSVPSNVLTNVCPAARLWTNRGWSGCSSDCSATNEIRYCCRTVYAPLGNCAKSSSYLKALCPTAYVWPHDDKSSRSCSGANNVEVSWGAYVENEHKKAPGE